MQQSVICGFGYMEAAETLLLDIRDDAWPNRSGMTPNTACQAADSLQ